MHDFQNNFFSPLQLLVRSSWLRPRNCLEDNLRSLTTFPLWSNHDLSQCKSLGDLSGMQIFLKCRHCTRYHPFEFVRQCNPSVFLCASRTMKGRQELRRSIKKDVATAEDSETDTGADMQSSQDILRTGQTVHHRRKRQIAYARRRISNRDRWSFVLLKFAVSRDTACRLSGVASLPSVFGLDKLTPAYMLVGA